MKYQKIWEKTLSNEEVVEHEFSIGRKYIKFSLVTGIIIGLIFIPLGGFGIFIILITLFNSYYSKVANAYALTNKRVLIHKGWLSTHTISVDYPKITDIHIMEPFLDRVLTHTGNIAIVTAGSTSDQIILKHIEAPYEIKKKLDSLKDKYYNHH